VCSDKFRQCRRWSKSATLPHGLGLPHDPTLRLDGCWGKQPYPCWRTGRNRFAGADFSDIHTTSYGPKLGIELTASAVESELAPRLGPWRVHEWSHWKLEVLLAVAIAWLNNRLLPLWATAGILLLLGLVFMASFLGIYYGVFRMEFLPFMIGIWIEQLVETSDRAHHAAH